MDDLIISVSGIRGVYGDSLTEKHAFDIGIAFGLWTKQEKVIVGRDTRPSGNQLAKSFIQGLLKAGKNVYDAGIVPTPAITWFVEKHTDFVGAVITASHNPLQYNGIKLISSKGTFLNPEEFEDFLAFFKDTKQNRKTKTGQYFSYNKLMDEFFIALFKCIDTHTIKENKFKVVVDPVQGAGSLHSKRFLEMLGCDVLMVNDIPIGEFSHNPEPIPDHLKELSKAVKDNCATVGFAQDPDCDRLALVLEDGNFVSEEQGLALLIKWMLNKKKGCVVVNNATTKIIEDICNQIGVNLFRTKVGEVYVVEKMKEVNAVAGGEGNGGVVFPDFHYGRDSFAGMALALEMMAKNGMKLSQFVNELPRYFFVKRKVSFPVNRIGVLYDCLEKEFISGKKDYTDGLRIDFEDAWLGIRPSGTEPIIRVFVEGKNENKVTSILKTIEQYLISCGKNL
ncbi:MAG: phosphoglucosamine mutase [Candidatus Omnitrophica bacterium]|nr:phosphoglucosamine mutase [Candidatus Omnitrophota bacterium]MCM8817554.1 phosphoglucosamine mutase [Candidatus Omnitrophota bacterium]